MEACCELLQLKHHFILVAPVPVFAGFDGLNDGVLHRLIVLRRVFADGGVAATYMPARPGEQDHPFT